MFTLLQYFLMKNTNTLYQKFCINLIMHLTVNPLSRHYSTIF